MLLTSGHLASLRWRVTAFGSNQSFTPDSRNGKIGAAHRRAARAIGYLTSSEQRFYSSSYDTEVRGVSQRAWSAQNPHSPAQTWSSSAGSLGWRSARLVRHLICCRHIPPATVQPNRSLENNGFRSAPQMGPMPPLSRVSRLVRDFQLDPPRGHARVRTRYRSRPGLRVDRAWVQR